MNEIDRGPLNELLDKDPNIWNFTDWITLKYDEFEAKRPGHEGSIAAFARYLEIDENIVRSWIKAGKIVSKHEYVLKLAKKLGINVYYALGIDPPEATLESLPPRPRDLLFSATSEIEKELGKRNINPDSPEAESIAIEIFAKFGIIVQSIKHL